MVGSQRTQLQVAGLRLRATPNPFRFCSGEARSCLCKENWACGSQLLSLSPFRCSLCWPQEGACSPCSCSILPQGPTCCPATAWTVARQSFLFLGFSGQEYWSGLPFPPPGGSSQPMETTRLSCLPRWQAGSLPLAPPGKKL